MRPFPSTASLMSLMTCGSRTAHPVCVQSSHASSAKEMLHHPNLLQSTFRRTALHRPFSGRCIIPPRPAVSAPENSATSSSTAASEDGPRFKANINFRSIKDNLAVHVQNAKDRCSSSDPQLVVHLYDQFLQLKQESELIRAERNENSGAMKVIY